MTPVLPPWAFPLAAYLIAAIPVGLIVARLKGIDLRTVGSGNIGATNAVRALGAKWGLVVFVLDVAKAYAPVRWADLALPADTPHHGAWVAATAVAAVVGHVHPVYLRFRGGKGVACALGVTFALDPALGLAGLVLYGQTLALTRISALGSLTAVTAMLLASWVGGRPMAFSVALTVIAAIIWLRHRTNIAQIRAATARVRASGAPERGER